MEHKLILIQDGQEYSFVAYRLPKVGDHFVEENRGIIAEAFTDFGHTCRLIVKPLRKEHVFSGVVFKETGEVRQVVSGDWYLWVVGSKAHVVNKPSETERTVQRYTILRPIALKGEEN